MKNFTLLVAAFMALTFFSCNLETISELETSVNATADKKAKKKTVLEEPPADLNDGTHCTVVRLIAGQHHVAGVVTVDNDGENLIITYSTNGDWLIYATHLDITDCSAGSFPTTNAGNPQVGHFQYNDTWAGGVSEVVYTIPLSEVSETYCFAAHAEVIGPAGGETAWGEGTDFGGRSWAMYVESNLSDCPDPNDDGGGDDGGDNGGGGPSGPSGPS